MNECVCVRARLVPRVSSLSSRCVTALQVIDREAPPPPNAPLRLNINKLLKLLSASVLAPELNRVLQILLAMNCDV